MAHLSSTSLFLLVALATVLVFSASCLFVLANPFPITRATLQNCKVGDLSFSEAARLDDFFVQPYETSIVEGIEIVHVAYDEGKNTLTVNDNYGSTEVPKPWFVVTRSAEEKALIIPTTNADYVLLKKNVGTAANGQDAAFKTEITLERGDFPQGDVMQERADEIAGFLLSRYNNEQYVISLKDSFTGDLRKRKDRIRITKLFDRLVIYQMIAPAWYGEHKRWIGCIWNASTHSGFYHHNLDLTIYKETYMDDFRMTLFRAAGPEIIQPAYEYTPKRISPVASRKIVKHMPSFGETNDETIILFLKAQNNTLRDEYQHRLQLYLDGDKLMVHSMEDLFFGRVVELTPAEGPEHEHNIALNVIVSIHAPPPKDEVDPPPKSLKLKFTIHFRLVANGPFKKGAYWSQSRETTGLVLA
eukprot:GHVS01107025.1.p1 GENE.GHVS01107025.1~~GHVS01107025.1.p1  ORF type:complete len:415 (+),score=49.42 GHVS01107025.1:182-1426(+)